MTNKPPKNQTGRTKWVIPQCDWVTIMAIQYGTGQFGQECRTSTQATEASGPDRIHQPT